MEIIVVLKWFNPLIYWFRNALRETHEFNADAYILQKVAPIQKYATALVEEAKIQQGRNAHLLSHTFHSLIKKRLNKMLQQKSRRAKSWKYLLTLPMIFGLMLLFSFNLVDQLPGGEKLEQLNEYLDELSETTVFEVDKNADEERIELNWGGQDFHIFLTEKESETYQSNLIKLEDLEKLFDEKPNISYNGTEIPIEESLMVYEGGGCVSTCQVKGGYGSFCYDKGKENVPDSSRFHLEAVLKPVGDFFT